MVEATRAIADIHDQYRQLMSKYELAQRGVDELARDLDADDSAPPFLPGAVADC